MGLGEWILVEGLLVWAGGLTFFGGVRGVLASAVVVTVLNFLLNGGPGFWFWEVILIVGSGSGIILLYFVGHKIGEQGVVQGLTGGLISLVLFGVFFTPVLGLLAWALLVGTGLIPKLKRKQVVWSLMPSLCRIALGLAWILLGNLMIS
ncbi:Hypothetical protein DEACI_2369 [Acididesulfobacillus acetoxydans]|uniref:Uncharacterized protein n=1 Tax=Acididesulfobacillus acetoxydans TaxID=1561005 RepID=A0A8S0WG97_9FIRM|nr:hypothetical protein [Acididesulfobacillus acetoxydans]CAA7601702.1 Hypothetical protein DEACI_2369 [Acididesulfobacillus acetoxydans]CEJ09079.1 Hypothetical protein DEACI_3562 [Acididesulfobacillus acetoxydans]